MKSLVTCIAGAGAAALLAATPAQAQYYPDRDRDTVEDVVEGIARVATAVSVATQGRYQDPRYGGYGRYGYRQGPERFAADACRYEAQRRFRRYGAVDVRIHDVRWHRRDRLRVHGEIELRGDRYGRYDRYGRNYGRGYERRAFTCTVRPDGRVTGFSTQRYRW